MILLAEIQKLDIALAKKIYLVDDLTSPVVVPGIVDYTEPADAVFAKASEAGMHVVQSTEPIAQAGIMLEFSITWTLSSGEVGNLAYQGRLKWRTYRYSSP